MSIRTDAPVAILLRAGMAMNRVMVMAAMATMMRLGKSRSRKQQHQGENEQLLHGAILAIARLRIRKRLPPHRTLLPEASTPGRRETKAASLPHQTSIFVQQLRPFAQKMTIGKQAAYIAAFTRNFFPPKIIYNFK